MIGTVNVDETTYMFSPKVLDRANVIEFRVSDDEMTSFLENPVKEALPETEGSFRARPATDKFVIHGWIKGPEHLEWVKESGRYNFRTEDRRGSLRLRESVAGASYILLHGEGDYQGGGQLFRIVSEGPRVFSKESLVESGYPGGGSQPYYLVYDVKPLSEGNPLNAYDWDLRNIDGIADKRESPVPRKGIPPNEFMKGARPKKQ